VTFVQTPLALRMSGLCVPARDRASMSEMGQSRRFHRGPFTSGLPQRADNSDPVGPWGAFADLRPTSREVRKMPMPDVGWAAVQNRGAMRRNAAR